MFGPQNIYRLHSGLWDSKYGNGWSEKWHPGLIGGKPNTNNLKQLIRFVYQACAVHHHTEMPLLLTWSNANLSKGGCATEHYVWCRRLS